MVSTNKYILSIPTLCIYISVGILTFLYAVFSEWNDDAIAYSFFIPRYGEDDSFAPITSLTDIWNSQINHYFNANGRFVVHFIVQIFCGLTGKYWFAAINALVWMVLIFNIVNLKPAQFQFKIGIAATILSIYLFFPLAFTPPFQINYVWVACAIVIWLRLLFSPKKFPAWKLCILAIAGFLIGEMHEGFSIPVGGAIIYYIVHKKWHLSKKEWTLVLSFGLGALLTIFAPGNFWRAAQESSSGGSILNFIEQLPQLIWFPLILLLLIWFNHDFRLLRNSAHSPLVKFLIAMIVTSLVFNLCLGRIGRGIIPYNLCFILLTVIYLNNRRIPRAVLILGSIAAVTVICIQIHDTNLQNRKTKAIVYEYMEVGTTDGIIFIDDDLFLFNKVETTQRRNTYTNKLRQSIPSAPFLKIYPYSMKNIDFRKDTNMVVKVGEQSWVCIQSATHPQDFIVEKTILPSLLGGKRMSPRILDFSSNSDIFIDSAADYKSILYVNDRPYVNAKIIIK